MVAGESSPLSAAVESTAVIWTRDGITIRLAPLPGFDFSEAFAVNELGEAAGISFSGERGDAPMATLWAADGIPIPLSPLPGDTASEAFGISDARKVVGHSIGLITRPVM
jgi:uncharacterized membrane protein